MTFAAGEPTTLLLMRHGETALTPEKRFSGSGGSDPALSETGRRQAEAAARLLAELGPVHAVVSSPLRRCRETAEPAARKLGLDIRLAAGLREADFGSWDGLTFAEVRDRYPEEWTAWLASPSAVPGGTGESLDSVTRRVEWSRDQLLARHTGQTVLVVSHVAPLRTLIRLALGAPPESLFRMELAAASISAVSYYGDGSASVRWFNDTSHLR
ncbi:histidine phosphatase family protein [Nocardia sp. CDC160]|uniref:histidine phosphatase family protein n=1 Tax=Nocardia sp. CDC160 TaxID=3112166 RepID=UPI002DB9AF7E|nr:histidine phosphatase family protein [Nocardia sp. CDC160]MEC3917017.1 histidine phosphatase family protein [Nocardia sp. CDC160]